MVGCINRFIRVAAGGRNGGVMPTIGFATIGQTPRDDLVPYLASQLGKPVDLLEGGVLDDLSPEEMASLDRGGRGLHMVTRLRDGGSARLSYELAVPRMQRVVDDLVTKGADVVVILCGADWSAVTASVPVVNPGKLFPNVIQALGAGSKVGVVKPSAGQVEHTVRQYDALGLDVAVTSAFPYDAQACEAAREAARFLRSEGAEMVWMTCVGMGDDMRAAVRGELDVPIILARSLLARVIGELVA
jgi:protein AroM